jgi:hypothetical protein
MTTIPKTEQEWRSLTDEQIHEIFTPMKLGDRLNVLSIAPKMYRLIGYYDKLTRSQVMQSYMNAMITYYKCSGHKKADQNKWRAETYKTLMETHKIPIPCNDICFVLGDFNGDGSY